MIQTRASATPGRGRLSRRLPASSQMVVKQAIRSLSRRYGEAEGNPHWMPVNIETILTALIILDETFRQRALFIHAGEE